MTYDEFLPALNFVDTFLDSPKAGKMIVWIKYPFYFFLRQNNVCFQYAFVEYM